MISIQGADSPGGRPSDSSPQVRHRIFSVISLTVPIQPPYAIACINVCARVKKIRALAAVTLFGNTKTLLTLIGTSISLHALAAVTPYQTDRA